jgi:DNA-binding transcriptional regulator YiaG
MSTLASTLKNEIARIARKELRDDLIAMRKAVAESRHEIAALKRGLRDTQFMLREEVRRSAQALRQLSQARPGASASNTAPETVRRGRRAVFDADRFKTQRERLGLTQKEMAAYLGTSSLSVWKWESGQVKPRANFLPAIFALRTRGKREVLKAIAATSE